jgi:pyridoxine/pyridoxamine 5'-phosphate oxidase
MSKQIPLATPELNRLRAAAGLIPIIESGLTDSKLSAERAALMASFCEWTTEKRPTDPEAIKLAESVDEGLKRIKMVLASAT